ncbi:hypothetical protein [Streptomyces massasporeus]|nr:hypothetical protein [Streptomyces massasporeus]
MAGPAAISSATLTVTAEAEKSFRWNVEGVEMLIPAGLILVTATAVCV